MQVKGLAEPTEVHVGSQVGVPKLTERVDQLMIAEALEIHAFTSV